MSISSEVIVEKLREKFCSYFMEASKTYGNIIAREALEGIDKYILEHPNMSFKQKRKYVRMRRIGPESKSLPRSE